MLVIVGGIIPEADIPTLKEAGRGRVFTPGAAAAIIVQWLADALDGARRRSDGERDRPRSGRGRLGRTPRRAARPSSPTRRTRQQDMTGASVDLFEYQGKQYFARFGIPTSPGGVADTVDEAVAQADAAGYPVVVKAQVKVGGRGKAGGIKLAADADEVRAHAGAILGMDIKGHVVHRLWVEHASDIAKEYYASFTLDRAAKLHLGMVSAKGGVEIEEVAAEDPEAIARLHVDPVGGLRPRPTPGPGGRGRPRRRGPRRGRRASSSQLYRCYVEGDCDLVEINPLDPHHRRPGARPRRQGHPRRQRRLPPSRVGRVRGTRRARRAGAAGQGEGPQYIGPRRLRRASSPTAPGWP